MLLKLNTFKRAINTGACSYPGVAGQAGHGVCSATLSVSFTDLQIQGWGHYSREYGLLLDSLISAEVVTADGTIRKVSASKDADLFFAIRGAAGSFGVITYFEFKTFPIPSSIVYFSYTWDWHWQTASKAAQTVQSLADSIPAAVGGTFNLFRGSARGRVSLTLTGVYVSASHILCWQSSVVKSARRSCHVQQCGQQASSDCV